MQPAIFDGHDLFAGNEVDAIWLKRHIILSFKNFHLRMAGKQFSHQAFIVWRKVLDDHKGEPVFSGMLSKQLIDSL